MQCAVAAIFSRLSDTTPTIRSTSSSLCDAPRATAVAPVSRSLSCFASSPSTLSSSRRFHSLYIACPHPRRIRPERKKQVNPHGQVLSRAVSAHRAPAVRCVGGGAATITTTTAGFVRRLLVTHRVDHLVPHPSPSGRDTLEPGKIETLCMITLH